MGKYDRRRFRQIMVDADLYRQLTALKTRSDTFGDVIRRLLEPTKKGRPPEELAALARIARRRWRRMLETGQVRIAGRPR